MRVDPPTRMTSLRSENLRLASFSACCTGMRQRSSRSEEISSNLARDRLLSMCLGPSAVAVMKGSEMEVCRGKRGNDSAKYPLLPLLEQQMYICKISASIEARD